MACKATDFFIFKAEMLKALKMFPQLPDFLDTPCGRVFLFLFPKENHRHTIHSILSEKAGFDVGEILQTKENERPVFSNSPFDANWSHSKNCCVLAYSESAKVGIDIEFLKPKSLRLAERFYSKEESIYLKELEQKNPEKAIQEFFRLWCRKEAYFKCIEGSFFEGSLKQNMLKNTYHEVTFFDFSGKVDNESFALAIAVK